MGRRGEREVSGKHVAIFVAPSKINWFKQRSHKAALGSGILGLFRAHANTDARYGNAFRIEKERETLSLPPPSPLHLYLKAHRFCSVRTRTGDRRLTKTFLLFLHELIYGRLESSFSLKHRIPAKVASASPARVK